MDMTKLCILKSLLLKIIVCLSSSKVNQFGAWDFEKFDVFEAAAF